MFNKISLGVVLILAFMQLMVALFPVSLVFNNKFDIFTQFFRFNLSCDVLTRVSLFSIGIVLFTVSLVARYIIKDSDLQSNFASLLLIALAGMNGVVLTRDIFSLYVFIEITAVASVILISFNKDIQALEKAFKYIIISAVASTLMLAAIALLMLLTGSTSLSTIAIALRISGNDMLVKFALGIFICGLFMKSGLMPFPGWLPDAYTAAYAPVSLFLAGIVTKVTGVYTLIRIVTSVFMPDNTVQHILMFVGVALIILGTLAALGQSDFKRMLAYSSISQIGYIILGFGCGTSLGLAAAVFHFFNHAIFKSLLFVNATAVELQSGTRNMDKMSGLACRMKVTGITSLIASLSESGIPPLAGFWSKFLIIIALGLSGHLVYALIAILTSIITAAYLFSLQRRVFFGKINKEFKDIKEASFSLSLPALILAGIIIFISLSSPFILKDFILPIGNIIGG
ncbi:MAG: proton-conducting transporter membrane subunit [Candidatus Omnitrophota bacterium]